MAEKKEEKPKDPYKILGEILAPKKEEKKPVPATPAKK